VRAQVLQRDGYCCRQCRARGRLDAHHLTYERFGHEQLSDCITLCRACHDRAHGRVPVSAAQKESSGCLVMLVMLALMLALLWLIKHV
jgi:5-methylcytosine-specific restriction endonuclease McrA